MGTYCHWDIAIFASLIYCLKRTSCVATWKLYKLTRNVVGSDQTTNYMHIFSNGNQEPGNTYKWTALAVKDPALHYNVISLVVDYPKTNTQL